MAGKTNPDLKPPSERREFLLESLVQGIEKKRLAAMFEDDGVVSEHE